MSDQSGPPPGPDLAGGIELSAIADGAMVAGRVGDAAVLLARRGEEFFAIISWGTTVKVFGSTGTDRASIWFHDTSRDYTRINDALKRLRELAPTVVHRAGEDGVVLSVLEWDGESGDLFDSGYNTVARYGDVVAVSRYPSP